MSYIRTPEHRSQAAQRIRAAAPWKRSTGPRTAEGKATASRNAFKGGMGAQVRALRKQANQMLRELHECIAA